MNFENSIDIREVEKALARKSFWHYLKLIDPEFYKDSRPHLKELAQTLQDFLEDKLIRADGKPYDMLILSLPPRVGKSYTLTNLCQWDLGIRKKDKIATVSYNEGMAGEFSRFVRDGIRQEKAEVDEVVYSDIFPKSKIKVGDGSAYKWALEGNYFSYIGCGINGSLTGKGFNIGIIDDPIKNAEEANNANVKEKHYTFYKNTFRSRIEEGGKQIINHTRWATDDLAGCLLRDIGEDKIYQYVRAMEEDGEMLCEEIMSRETWEEIKQIIDPNIISANYMQIPIDIEGRLYSKFMNYDDLPKGGLVKNYTDTADTGADYLCSITYLEYKNQAYILDVFYSNEPMEITEPATAQMLRDNHVKIARIESNNGGRSFARNVQRILRDRFQTTETVISWFHQSKNKQARIFSNSFWVQENVFWPYNWHNKWPEFYRDISSYIKDGKNAHDDAPDLDQVLRLMCFRNSSILSLFFT
jgi:predicted phage terminase large subunit-like protein